jgi:hypothetical protein
LYWWNPQGINLQTRQATGEYEEVKNQKYDAPKKCIEVVIEENGVPPTSPTLAQMTGTVFGVALAPASTPGSTTTTLQVSNANPLVGEKVKYTASVTPGEAFGAVEFLDGGKPIEGCLAQTLTPGATSATATCEPSYKAAGSHSITATFTGDERFGGSTSSPAETVTVKAAPVAPTVTSIEPDVGPTGGKQEVTIKGTGFVAGAKVDFTEAGITSAVEEDIPGDIPSKEASDVVVVSSTEITAETPAAEAGSYDVLVSDSNGASTTGPAYTYLPLTHSASGTSNGSEASASIGLLSAKATGPAGTTTGAVTVGQYASDPVGSQPLRSAGEYIDVSLASGNNFNKLEFTDCELGEGSKVEWYNPATKLYEPVSDETSVFKNADKQECITVTITSATTPDLKEMIGTVFGVALPPASTSEPPTGGGGSSTPPASSTTPATTTTPAITAATGSVSLASSSIPVQGSGAAAVKLTCTGTATCSGELTLTAKSTAKKGNKKSKKVKTGTIATASFSIPAGTTATVKLSLSGAGKALLKAAHGHLSATLTIVKSSPSPAQTSTDSIHLSQQKAGKAKKGKK